jgi:carboxypeptidase D
MHTGAVVASYPYDASPGIPSGTLAPTPDHALFLDLATTYASNNPPMFANNTPPFQNGVTNGNEWFVVEGGMQDWMYRFLGDDEITLELALPKKPSSASLPGYWDDNRESMLSYLEWVHRGVRGIITDATTSGPLQATVQVVGNSQLVFSDPDVGDYYRLLRPGTYTLRYEALFYGPEIVSGVVVTSGAATLVDVALTPLAGLPVSSRAGWVVLMLALGTGFVVVAGKSPRRARHRSPLKSAGAPRRGD